MNFTKEIIFRLLPALLIIIFLHTPSIVAANRSLAAEGTITAVTGSNSSSIALQHSNYNDYQFSFIGGNNPNVPATAFFNVRGLTNWEDYNTFSVHLRNNGKSILKIALQIKLSPLVILSVDDNTPCFFHYDGDSALTIISPQDNAIDIAPNESGTLIIPFSSLNFKGRKFPITYFNAWDLQIQSEKNTPAALALSNFSLYAAGELNLPTADRQILGDSSVQIPIEGTESIALYKLPNIGAAFHLLKNYTGIKISPSGRLSVNSQAQKGIIKIIAVVNNTRYEKRILIEPSVRANVTDKNGVKPLLPPANKLKPIFNPNGLLNNPILYTCLRILLILLFIAGTIFFLYGNKLYEKNNKKGQ